MNETELERLIVKIVGDATQYVKAMQQTVNVTKATEGEVKTSLKQVELAHKAVGQQLKVNTIKETAAAFGLTAMAGTIGKAVATAAAEVELLNFQLERSAKLGGQAADAFSRVLARPLKEAGLLAPGQTDEQIAKLTEGMRHAEKEAQGMGARQRDLINQIQQQLEFVPSLARELGGVVPLFGDLIKRSQGVGLDELKAQLKETDDQLARTKDQARQFKDAIEEVKRAAADRQLERDLKQAAEEGRRVFEAGQQVFEQTRTPLEKFEAEVARLNGLLEDNAVNQDTFNRGVALAKKELDEATKKTKETRQEIEALDAMLSGGTKSRQFLASHVLNVGVATRQGKSAGDATRDRLLQQVVDNTGQLAANVIAIVEARF